MDDYVSKPIKAGELLSVIERVSPVPARKRVTPSLASPDISLEIPDELLDLSRALVVADGDINLFMELIGPFLEQYPELINKIRTGISEGDAKRVEHAAHHLKSALENIGAKNLSDTAHRLEIMGREGGLEKASETLSKLEEGLGELDRRLHNLLKKKK